MNENEVIESKFEKAFKQSSGGNPVFPYIAKQQMGKMVEVIAKGNENIAQILKTDQTAAVKGGFLAEEFHSETFNLDAILNDSEVRALTDRHESWSSHDWNGAPLGKNGIPDIAIVDDGKVVSTAQSKYYKTPEQTNAKMSQVKDGQVKYGEVDQLIGPDDQVNPQHGEYSVKEHAEAAAYGNEARGGDPAQTAAYDNTAEKVTGTLSDGESSSRPLTKAESETMGEGDLRKLKTIEKEYQTRSTVTQMKSAAVNAAVMSAVVSGSINTVRYIQLAREGKITAEEATLKIVQETVCSAADSAVKASANVGLQSLMVRYGAEKVVLGTLAKQGMGAMMRTNVVTVGVVCAVDVVKDLVRLGMDDISKEEFYERQGKNLLTTSAGVMGGSLGATAVGSAIATMGFTTATTNALLVAGGLSGGLIAGLAMALAIENGIEKPYRDLVQNTDYLQEAARELERVSQSVFMSQVLFCKYIEEDLHLERQLQTQMENIDQAGSNALNAILKV